MDSERSKTLFLLFVLVLIYLPFITAPLFFDDLPFFARYVSSFADAPFDFGRRWFSYTSIGFTWVFAGENPALFRLGNLLLHGMNVLLLLLLLRLWISLFVVGESKEKLAAWGAWLGALVFACHPLAVYGVGYLVERSMLMATLFSLVMQLAYLRGLLENNKKYLVLAVAAYFLAVYSKEHSVMAPAILLPLTWLMRGRIRFSISTLVATWIGFALVGLLAVMSAKGVIGVAYEPDAARLFGQQDMLKGVHELHLLSVLTQAGLFFKYCLLMLLPNPAWMSIDMRETFILSYRDWTSWIGLLAFIGYGLFALRCLYRGGRVALLGLALLYPWLLFIPEFSSIRVQESFVLYRSYLWLPGYMLLLPLLVSALPEKKIMLVGGLAALLLIPLAWNRLWVFENHFRLWDDAVQLLHGEDRLGAQRTYYNRAHASTVLKNWDVAIIDYQKSLSIDSSHPQVYMALSTAYFGAKRYSEALSILDKLIVQDAKNAELHFNKAVVLMKLKGKAASLSELELSCDLGKAVACGMLQFSHLKKN
ncbi:MAG: tetratricopeptide repeat protein [Gallionellaceae bacterium]